MKSNITTIGFPGSLATGEFRSMKRDANLDTSKTIDVNGGFNTSYNFQGKHCF